MRILVIAMALVLAAQASTEQTHKPKFVIKGFYAGMSKEAFYKVASQNGLEEVTCDKPVMGFSDCLWEGSDKVRFYPNEQTEPMTVGGYPVRYIRWYEGSFLKDLEKLHGTLFDKDIPARISIYIDVDDELYEEHTPEGMLDALSARFGEPEHVTNRICMGPKELAYVRKENPNVEKCYDDSKAQWENGAEVMMLSEGSPHISLIHPTILPELPESNSSDF